MKYDLIDPETVPPSRIARKRRDKSRCPFCNNRLPKTSRGGRRVRQCPTCKATIDRARNTLCCPKAEVWYCKGERRCFTCGKAIETDGIQV